MKASERLRLEASRQRDHAVGLGISAEEYSEFKAFLGTFPRGHTAVSAWLCWKRATWIEEMADRIEIYEDNDEPTNPGMVVPQWSPQ
jgi:hypothetical protein